MRISTNSTSFAVMLPLTDLPGLTNAFHPETGPVR